MSFYTKKTEAVAGKFGCSSNFKHNHAACFAHWHLLRI